MSSSRRDLGIAVSLANLYQLRVWTSVLCPWSRSRAEHAAAIINTAILALALWGAMRLVRRSGVTALLTLARGVVVLALLVRLPGIVRAIYPVVETTHWFGPARAGWITLSAVAIVAALAVRRGPLLSSVASRVLLALLPALVVTAGQSAWNIAAYGHRSIDDVGSSRRGPSGISRPAAADTPRPAVKPAADPDGPRVVVLLLDELEYHLGFVSRDPSVQLPALDRLRRETVWATQSYPPAGCTTQSVATWLTGKLVHHHWPRSDGDIEIRFTGSPKTELLSDQRTLFTEACEWGIRPVVVGWGLPYGLLFGSDVCATDLRLGHSGSARLGEEMFRHFLLALTDVPMPLPPFLAQARDALPRKAAVATYHAFLSAAERNAADPAGRLVFMHCPVPHDPFIFDADTGEVTAAPGRTYSDNLALADHTLARVRAAMEANGEWERSAVLVVSDHWWRGRPAELPPDHRTPFALKLPGQVSGVEYSRPFNTVLLHDLLVALLRRELQKPAEVARWLDRHRTFGESPVTAILLRPQAGGKGASPSPAHG